MGNRKILQTLFLVTQLGLSMLAPIGLGAVVGILLDRKLGTTYWVVILLFLGILAGFRNCWKLLRKHMPADDPVRVVPSGKREHLSEAELEFRRWQEAHKSEESDNKTLHNGGEN